MSDRGTLETIIWEITQAVKSFQPIISSPQSIKSWMADLGWEVEIPAASNIAGIQTAFNGLVDAVTTIDFSKPAQEQIEMYEMALRAALEFVNEISDVHTIFDGVVVPPGFLENVISQIASEVIFNHLEINHPALYSLLIFFGIIIVEEKSEIPNRIDYTHRYLILENIIAYISDPKKPFVSIYKWGTDSFEVEKLVSNLNRFFQDIGIPTYVIRQSDELENHLQSGFNEFSKARQFQLRIPFLDLVDEDIGSAELGIAIIPLYEQDIDSLTARGICIQPYVEGVADVEIPLGKGFSLRTRGNINISLLSKITPQGISILSLDELGQSENFSGELSVSLQKKSEEPGSRIILIGQSGGSRIDMESITFTWGLASNNNTVELKLEIEFENGEILIQSNDADGFLKKLINDSTIKSNFDFGIGWSSLDGIYFRGSAALEITIPIHKTLGPLNIDEIYLALKIDGRRIPISIATSFGAELGPITASVKRIGIKFPISFPEGGDGNLGPVQIDTPQFLPPLGAGISGDTGSVKIGGYLEFDNDHKRYAGILELAFGEIGLIAIGLITTKMPDGSKGFSMLVIIGVEFDPPIALPYNFNLSGVGGLLGIQRSMNVDFLREGLRQGTLDSVLFPQDPIANAARIISDLRSGFPPDRGRYLFGPMAIIGWGNPKIIRAEVGIFIEFPKPIRIAILGQITAQLPNADGDSDTIVEIHLDILGVLNFEKKTFSLDATIYDSRILQFPLSGDMAMRFCWGDPPFFLVSFGGYNPKFKVKPGMPALRRMMLSIGKGNNPRLSLVCYMALTTNSFQFGAKLELIAKKSKFKVHGYLYFDALFIFSPFSFVIDMGAGVEIFVGSRSLLSITLDFTLSGPTPWRAKGTGKFKILFVKVKIRFDVKWGRRGGNKLPATDPWPLLYEALNNSGNWKGLLPGTGEQIIRLKKIEEQEDLIIVHPRGRIEISQNIVPFNLTLEKYGNHPIAGDTEYYVTEINDLAVDDNDAIAVDYTEEYHPIGQSIKLSDSEKISRPSFEELYMNIVIGSENITAGDSLRYDLAYETEVIDENKVTHELPSTELSGRNGMSGLKSRAKRSIGASKYYNSAKQPLVSTLKESFNLVDKNNMMNLADTALSYAQARTMQSRYLNDNSSAEGNTQIISEFEMIP